LKGRALKQIELLVDHDDHENGAEGVRAAPHARNPLELSPTLECVTLDGNSPQLLLGATKRKLKSLRVYCDYDLNNHLFTLLQRPVCSELESFLLDIRGGWWGDTTGGPSINFARLKWLFLGNWLNYFAGCQFPQLVTLLGGHRLTAVQERRWPKLQTLEASFENRAELLAFAQSDCCPNLTTLNLNAGYSAPSKTDYSFLANCPHMPHLSLVRVSAYPDSGEYIVSDGQLLPVRADVMLDELAPSMPYRVRFAFSCGPVTP
jgi:hypothetical protein